MDREPGSQFDWKRFFSSLEQHHNQVKLQECATCNLEIWSPNSVRGHGNYKQYCSCVRVQVPKK